MEIKDTLKKPCTDKARADFIVENNHNKGYQIKETETALEAWGDTEEESSEKEELEREQLIQEEYELALKDLKDRMATADLQGNEEWKTELREEYLELMGEDEEPEDEPTEEQTEEIENE